MGLAKHGALHVLGCPAPPSDSPDPAAPAFPGMSCPAHAGHSQLMHRGASGEVPMTKEKKSIPVHIRPLLHI